MMTSHGIVASTKLDMELKLELVMELEQIFHIARLLTLVVDECIIAPITITNHILLCHQV